MYIDLDFLDRKRSGLRVKVQDNWHKSSVAKSFGAKRNFNSLSNIKSTEKREKGNSAVEKLVRDTRVAQAYALVYKNSFQ